MEILYNCKPNYCQQRRICFYNSNFDCFKLIAVTSKDYNEYVRNMHFVINISVLKELYRARLKSVSRLLLRQTRSAVRLTSCSDEVSRMEVTAELSNNHKLSRKEQRHSK